MTPTVKYIATDCPATVHLSSHSAADIIAKSSDCSYLLKMVMVVSSCVFPLVSVRDSPPRLGGIQSD